MENFEIRSDVRTLLEIRGFSKITSLSDYIIQAETKDTTMFCFTYDNLNKLGATNTYKELEERAKSVTNKIFVLILYNSTNSQAKEFINLIGKIYSLQLLSFKEISFVPTTHVNSKRHELVPHSEFSERLKKHNLPQVKVEHLRRIPETDAVIRYMGWKHGDIIQIERNKVEFVLVHQFDDKTGDSGGSDD